MVTRDLSGDDIVKVLVNVGNYYVDRIRGDHMVLKWEPPADHDTEPRTVSVARHDSLDIGTLHKIADQAGAENFDEFCKGLIGTDSNHSLSRRIARGC